MQNIDHQETKTYFAPAQRLNGEGVIKQHKKIAESEFLDSVLTKIPFVFLILNTDRQIIYSNELLMQALGYDKIADVMGLRPGEMFHCIHSKEEKGGCGTSKSCRYCGAVQAVIESQKKKELVIKECRLIVKVNTEEIAQDFEVSSKPFNWEDEVFYIITLNDISSKKRKEHLERVFFHDLINKAGSLSGLVELIQERGQVDNTDALLDLVNRGMKELLRDITYQKQIQQAENGNLQINPNPVNSLEILYNLRGDFRSTLERQNKKIQIDQNSDDINFITDPVLLNRVLTNLVKNALEASRSGESVTMRFSKENDTCCYYVSNPKLLSEEVKSQIFKRSFSTKGKGRGIGTYSIKLFTETYLKGKVSFTSKEKEGTVFKVELPFDQPAEFL